MKKLDIFGISASLVCAAHCSILPIAIAGGFLSNSFLTGHGIFEYIFIIISIAIGVSSLVKSYRYIHRSKGPVLYFTLGLTLLFIGLRFHGWTEIMLATSGGLLIAFAHLHNLRLNKSIQNRVIS